MGAEKYMRRHVMEALRGLHPVAIETNGVAPGTPDVNHIYGWLELKQLPGWPKRPETVVQVPTYTPYQRIWMRDRKRAGGHVQVLLRVGEEWLLFDGSVAITHLGKVVRDELVKVALKHWQRGLNHEELRNLCRPTSSVVQNDSLSGDAVLG